MGAVAVATARCQRCAVTVTVLSLPLLNAAEVAALSIDESFLTGAGCTKLPTVLPVNNKAKMLIAMHLAYIPCIGSTGTFRLTELHCIIWVYMDSGSAGDQNYESSSSPAHQLARSSYGAASNDQLSYASPSHCPVIYGLPVQPLRSITAINCRQDITAIPSRVDCRPLNSWWQGMALGSLLLGTAQGSCCH
eukprot:1141478-Pelagomonas_calceolata.AAC.2